MGGAGSPGAVLGAGKVGGLLPPVPQFRDSMVRDRGRLKCYDQKRISFLGFPDQTDNQAIVPKGGLVVPLLTMCPCLGLAAAGGR